MKRCNGKAYWTPTLIKTTTSKKEIKKNFRFLPISQRITVAS